MAQDKHIILFKVKLLDSQTTPPPILAGAFTFDRMDITFDTLLRTFDEL